MLIITPTPVGSHPSEQRFTMANGFYRWIVLLLQWQRQHLLQLRQWIFHLHCARRKYLQEVRDGAVFSVKTGCDISVGILAQPSIPPPYAQLRVTTYSGQSFPLRLVS